MMRRVVTCLREVPPATDHMEQGPEDPPISLMLLEVKGRRHMEARSVEEKEKTKKLIWSTQIGLLHANASQWNQRSRSLLLGLSWGRTKEHFQLICQHTLSMFA
mmetsp:Transcript_24860/g.72834  ORF Transcript_24860/g.72834 Transcript_24860/m.72834 type:complete len:104 (-) Transcript_24860:707-1018(-)